MNRSFNSFKRSPGLVCWVLSLVIIYIVYGLLLVPRTSNTGSRMLLATPAAPPPGNVAILAARQAQEALERAAIANEARRAVEPRELMNRVKEIGLEVRDRGDSVFAIGDLDYDLELAKTLEASPTNDRITTALSPVKDRGAERLEGGKLVLSGPEVEDGIIPGRQLPAECNAEPHTDYGGVAVTWGLSNPKESAADCCQACIDQAKGAQEGDLRCTLWVYCPAEEGCFSPDIYQHKQFECWLKQSDSPTISFKGRYPPDYRASHPTCTEVVAWVSGVISRP